jgi:hypothetical protein
VTKQVERRYEHHFLSVCLVGFTCARSKSVPLDLVIAVL